MKILYDAQAFSIQNYGGVSRYFYEIIKRINNIEDVLFPTFYSDNYYINDFFIKKSIKENHNFKGKKFLYRNVNNILFKSEIKKMKYDLFHPTYYNPYFLQVINSPYVLTVHDMTHELFQISSFFDKTARYKRELVHEASRIIAVSNNTKMDLVRLLKLDESKVDVIYHGNSIVKSSMNCKNNFGKYILFIGNRSGYKNFEYLVKSISKILINSNLKLICAGSLAFSTNEYDLFKSLGIKDKLFQVPINENLYDLYSNALFFIFPSKYEGFGIPILESFSANCPVLLSDASCFPEIGAEACIYFNINDEKDLRSKVYSLLNNKKLREQLKILGKKRLRDFSWEISTKETQEVYRRALNEK